MERTACGEDDELREGEAEEDAAAGEAGELHRPQPKPALLVFC
jgi:hypothetical protein